MSGSGPAAAHGGYVDVGGRRPGRSRGDLVHSEEEMRLVLLRLKQQEEQYAQAYGGCTLRPAEHSTMTASAPRRMWARVRPSHRDDYDDDDDFEMRYKRTLAVVTPMELDAHALKFKYRNNNGACRGSGQTSGGWEQVMSGNGVHTDQPAATLSGAGAVGCDCAPLVAGNPGLVLDSHAVHEELRWIKPWTDEERVRSHTGV